MDINWREMLKHTLKYIAYIMFYLEESEFCLPLDGGDEFANRREM